MNEKLTSITEELDRLSADISQMLARVATMQQTVKALARDLPPEPLPAPEPAEPALEPETVPTVESTEVPATVTDEEPTASQQAPGPLRETPARDLRKLFTINDLYRFRRELFGNSDSEMADTVNLIAAMNSLDEAEDYVYGDLGWSRDNDEVADFMTIVGRAFGRRVY